MAFQGPKADEGENDEAGGLFAEINITPFTDVVLVLLIIFMVSSSAMVDAVRDGQIDVTLPSASTAAHEEIAGDTLIVGITSDGRLYVQGKALSEEELVEMLKAQKKTSPNTMVVVQADGELAHKKVVEVIDLLRETGFQNVGIGAEAP